MTARHIQPTDPTIAVLQELERRTGLRRRYADPLTALRELEQRTGAPPYMFGASIPPEQG